jgi:hypothetical protein
VAGNLVVQGNVTAIETTDLIVEDPLILLAKDQTGTPGLDIGFIGKRGTENNIAFVWDESADQFVAVFTDSEVTNTVVNITSYASMQVADFTAANVDITGNVQFSGNIVGSFVVTGNVDANNINSVNAVTGVSADFSANVVANNVSANTSISSVTITASGNLVGNNAVITNDVSAATGTFTGNVSANNVNTTTSVNSVTISASGNLVGNNAVITNDVSAATGTFTGNVSGETWLGNVEGTYSSFTGNVDAGNVNATNSVTATDVVETGNVDAGNVNATNSVTATDVVATGNVDAGTAVNANLIAGTSVAIESQGDLTLDPTGNIDVSGVIITNMGTPVLSFDAATKQYVDDAVSSGITIHQPVRLLDRTLTQIGTYAQGGNTFTVTDTIAGNTVVFSTAANLQVNDQLWFSNSFNGVVGNLAYFVVSTPNTSAAVLSTAYSGTPVSNITSGSGLTQSVRVNSGQGATLTATSNGALIVDSVNPIVGDRILLETQAADIENGVYVVTDAGNVSAPWILTRSSDMNTYIPDNINGVDSGDYFYVEEGANFAGQSHVMTSPVGPVIIGFDGLVFTLFSASQVYSANVNAGLVLLNGTQFNAKVDNDTTAFDIGGNISVKAGANLVTPNIGNAIGNSLTLTGNGLITAANINISGNVLSGNLNSNAAVTGVTITASGNLVGNNAVVTNDVSAATGTFTGNVTANNVNATDSVTAVTITASGNINANNAVVTNETNSNNFTATGTVTTPNITSTGGLAITTAADGNITLNPNGTGVIILEDETADRMLFTGANREIATNANATFDGANLVITGSITGDNVVIDGDNITSLGSELTINGAGADVNFRVAGDGQANLLVVDAGSDTVLIGTGAPTTEAALKIGTTDSILVPVGNTLQRPSVPVTGMVRFNTTIDNLEFYDADGWTPAGSLFTVITADQFTGDGSTVVFTLSEESTTAATLVNINGVVQQPITAYAVTGNVLTFTEAPESTDEIDVRLITTTTTVTALQNTSGNAVFEASETSSAFVTTGNILPSANVTYNLGSDTARWNDLFLAGSTIALGNIVMKNTGGNTVGFFGPDGTTPATLDANVQVVGDAIESGTSNVSFVGANGNVLLVSGGNTTGIVTSTGANVAGYVTATGNITGGNVSTAGLITATGNITGGNLITAGLVSLSSIVKTGSNGVGNIGSSSNTFNTVFAKATSAQYADLAEMYEADQAIEPGTVVSFGGNKEVHISTQDADRRVAGVISTNPSYIMNSTLEGDHVVAVALTGRVPTRVLGNVRKGDMMVSAGNGAARAESDPVIGTVIGKALEDHTGESGVIEVVIGRL